MLQDLDRLGPELILMVAAGCVPLADLALRDRPRGWLAVGPPGLLGAVASAVILYGMAFLFGIAGTTKLVAPDGGASIAGLVAQGDPGTRAALVAAIVMLAAGLSFKMALVPFQMWVPDIYQGAATPVAAFLS